MNSQNSEKGHNVGAKEGERFRDKVTGKVHIVETVSGGRFCCKEKTAGENGSPTQRTLRQLATGWKIRCERHELT